MTSSTGELEVHAVDLEPTRRGYQITYNYAVRFWLPLLTAIPYAVWQSLISFCFQDNVCWPSISLLADMATKGNRHLIIGRWRENGEQRYRQPGALEVLESYGLLRIETRDPGPEQRHRFHVLKEPPMLTPDQLAKLPKHIQQMHAGLLERCNMDRETYEQLSTSYPQSEARVVSLTPPPLAPGTTPLAPGTTPSAPDTTKNYSLSKTLEEVWREVLDELSLQMTKSNFNTLFLNTLPLSWSPEAGLLVIGADSPMAAQWLTERFDAVVARTVRDLKTEIDGVPIRQVEYTCQH